MIPSNEQLKQESVLGQISHIKEELVKLAKMKAELKEKEKLLKEQLSEVANLMLELNMDELFLDKDVKITCVKPYSYKRMMGIKTIEKKFPHILMKYPEIITEVNVKGYVKLETIK